MTKPTFSGASTGGGQPRARRKRRKLAPSQKYEVFTAVLTSSATQQELADRCGCTRQTIVALEKNRYVPSLALAFSFGFYGLIRKVVPVGPLVGLTVETLLLSVPATAYLIYVDHAGRGAFLNAGASITLLLMGAALVTGLPLLLFTMGTKLLRLATVGFLQYIAPSCTFLLAVFIYREPLVPAQLFTFGLIWTALAIYSYDSVRQYRIA